MKEVIAFGVGAVAGGVAATVFSNPIRKEIKVATEEIKNLIGASIQRFHGLVFRLEEAVRKLEAKL